MLARRRARIPAELSLRFDGIEELDAALDTAIVTRRAPWEAGFLAARVILQYRRGGGLRRSLARLLHRRPCGTRGVDAPDAGRAPIPDLLSTAAAARAATL